MTTNKPATSDPDMDGPVNPRNERDMQGVYLDSADALSALEKERDELRRDNVRLSRALEYGRVGVLEKERDKLREALEKIIAAQGDYLPDFDICAVARAALELTEEVERAKQACDGYLEHAAWLRATNATLVLALEAIANGSWNTVEHNPTGKLKTVHQFARAALKT